MFQRVIQVYQQRGLTNNMAYTTINKSTAHFNTKLHTGTGSSQSISGIGFQPDLCWFKKRDGTTEHQLYDAVRTATKVISSQNTDAEWTESTGLTSFDSDGYTLGGASGTNGSSNTYAVWNWKANGAGSTNNDGSVTSTVSVNATAGFSIVKYNVGSSGAITVGHGLGSAPELIITKGYSGTSNWIMSADALHQTWETYMLLNTNQAESDSNLWEDVAPTSTVFATSSPVYGNNMENIAYCFKSIDGYSKIGSYWGNSDSAGSFIYTGFKPKFLMLKRINGDDWWGMYDSKRNPSNTIDKRIYANANDAEGTSSNVAFLSNGFQIRTTDSAINNSSGEYLYYAVGQTIVGTNNVPATAF